MIPELAARDRWQAIDELFDWLVTHGKIKAENKESILAVVRKREQSMSTGIGYGFGMPHASVNNIPEFICAAGRSKAGIQFDAIDKKPVHFVVLFLMPTGQFQKHLHIFAKLGKLLHNDKFRHKMEQSSDPDAILKALIDNGEQ